MKNRDHLKMPFEQLLHQLLHEKLTRESSSNHRPAGRQKGIDRPSLSLTLSAGRWLCTTI